jgi:hypothetical protein
VGSAVFLTTAGVVVGTVLVLLVSVRLTLAARVLRSKLRPCEGFAGASVLSGGFRLAADDDDDDDGTRWEPRAASRTDGRMDMSASAAAVDLSVGE